jgi:hypothetical protein
MLINHAVRLKFRGHLNTFDLLTYDIIHLFTYGIIDLDRLTPLFLQPHGYLTPKTRVIT